MPALYSRPLLLEIAPYFPLGTGYSTVSMAFSFSLSTQFPDTSVTSYWEHLPEGSLWPQKHAQSPCLEQARGAGELMSPEAVLNQR